jgi:VWFA-related protein
MKIPKVAAVISFVLLGTGSAAAQSNPPQTTPPPATAGQADTAAIYITAGTKKGFVVTDLKPEDLTLTEDKAPAKIEKITCGRPEPLLVGILVDVSGSRHGDPHLGSYYEALHAFVNRLLTGDDATYLVDFSDFPVRLGDATGDPAAISAAFSKLRLDPLRGSTAMYDAIKASANMYFPGRSGRRILVVVGDWEDNSSHIDMDQAVEAAQRNSTTVYPIVDATDSDFFKEKAYKRALSVAKEVAEGTGGWSYDVHGEKDFAMALQGIQVAILGSCRVDYSVPGTAVPKKGIKLHVDASSKDISILYPRVRLSTAP